uniref:Aftiphilin clathrin-binding box domain-containing protein n=1 Tax=Catagonus wagneri TaxID=51154 RepID=A0A8C3W1S6_9CETA
PRRRRRRGGALLSDLTERAGGVSLCQVSENSDADSPRQRPGPADPSPRVSGHCKGLSTCAASGPDPGEHPGAWGQFEGFQESSARSEQLSRALELPERPTEPQPPSTASAQGERGSPQPRQGGPAWTEATAVSPSEHILSYADIFRSAFQEVPAQQAAGDVPALDHFLETSAEEKPGLESLHEPCSESRKVWRALQSSVSTSASRCPRSESRCWESLLLALRLDAAQGQPGLPEPEGLQGARGFCLHRCRALIRTKLSVTPGSSQGGLAAYGLFLKTPLQGGRRGASPPRRSPRLVTQR